MWKNSNIFVNCNAAGSKKETVEETSAKKGQVKADAAEKKNVRNTSVDPKEQVKTETR